MDEYITRAEHAEFCARLDAENNRQNRRIEILEGTTKQISELTTSVQKLAMSVENMVKEQGRQGDRLEALENRDGEMWRKVTGYVLTTIIGIAIGFLAKQIGFLSFPHFYPQTHINELKINKARLFAVLTDFYSYVRKCLSKHFEAAPEPVRMIIRRV